MKQRPSIEQDQKRALVGSAYRWDRNLIFADPAGEYLLPSSVSRAAGRFARRLGHRDGKAGRAAGI